jgi:hypothetical protein
MDLKNERDDKNWAQPVEDRDQWRALVNMAVKHRFSSREFLDQLSDY